MTDDLNILRPEVREALDEMDRIARIIPAQCSDELRIIRAELLRLTDDCARLVDCINAQPPTRRRLIDRAERAEAELAALKARIADSPVASLVYGQGDLLAVISAENPDDWAGKRVRLVVEE